MSETKNTTPTTKDYLPELANRDEALPATVREESQGLDERTVAGKKAASSPQPQRLWAKHKSEAVIRLFSGEQIDLIAREYGVPVSTVAEWRNTFLAAGETALKSGKKQDAKDVEIKHLKETIGDLTMDLQIVKAAVQVYKEKYPFAFRKRKK